MWRTHCQSLTAATQNSHEDGEDDCEDGGEDDDEDDGEDDYEEDGEDYGDDEGEDDGEDDYEDDGEKVDNDYAFYLTCIIAVHRSCHNWITSQMIEMDLGVLHEADQLQ